MKVFCMSASPSLVVDMEIRHYRDKFRSHQQTLDLMFIGTYLASSVTDAFMTFINIKHYTEESNQFVSFMMERYGVGEGLLRIHGIETLQLAAMLGLAHITIGLWNWLKKELIDTQIRFTVVYVYTAVGIAKHVDGILSWF